MNTWQHLREPFDQTLSEARAISLRGGESDLRMATLASNHRHGYGFQFSQFSSSDHRPDLVMRWSPWIHGSGRGVGSEGLRAPGWCEPVFTYGRLGPDVIERGIRYGTVGLDFNEELLRTTGADYAWSINILRDAYRPFHPCWHETETPLPWRFHLLIESRRPLSLRRTKGCLVMQAQDSTDVMTLTLSADHAIWGDPLVLAEHELESSEVDMWANGATPGRVPAEPCHRLAIPLSLWFLPAERASLRLLISMSDSSERVFALAMPDAIPRERAAVAADWDNWFMAWGDGPSLPHVPDLAAQLEGRASRLPRPTYRDRNGIDQPQSIAVVRPLPILGADDLARAWQKCIALTRLCERLDPNWGRSLTETFTCYYSGTFGWSLPVIAWYAGRQGNPVWRAIVRDSLAAYREMQAEDGAIPCFVSFCHQRPKTRPTSFLNTQQPQIAWTVWQEFLHSGDHEWLAGYVEPLLRCRDFFDRRDRDLLALGLWSQHHYYDGLDMFPTVDGLVLRGDTVLYSAAYAAEQVQFQRALARILAKVGDDRAAGVAASADAAHARMITLLWDEDRQWFGDILADGRRETVVGMQGLFALAYGLAPVGADPARLRGNLEALIAPFGICTVAPEDVRFTERFFWRGPVWPASCLYGAAAARRYAPDLLPRIAAATTRFILAQPNIWECLEPHSGQVACYDEGHGAMPGTSSVVGSFAAATALEIACGGEDPFAL